MSEPAQKRATYADLFELPAHHVGQIIDGVLYANPRPATAHANASAALGEELGPPFKRGRGGPGGWIILDEPELHLGTEPDILVPDLAGWRRERMPELANVPYLTLSPDWVCEVLSPSTHKVDRVHKLPVYQREQVAHVWFVDPAAKTLEIFRFEHGAYRWVVTFADDQLCRAEPFDAIELELGLLWLK